MSGLYWVLKDIENLFRANPYDLVCQSENLFDCSS